MCMGEGKRSDKSEGLLRAAPVLLALCTLRRELTRSTSRSQVAHHR